MKQCPACRREQPLEAFNRDRRRPDGHGVYCRACNKRLAATYHAARHSDAPKPRPHEIMEAMMGYITAHEGASAEQIGGVLSMSARSAAIYLGRLMHRKQIERQKVVQEGREVGVYYLQRFDGEDELEISAKREATRRDLEAYHAAGQKIGSLHAIFGQTRK